MNAEKNALNPTFIQDVREMLIQARQKTYATVVNLRNFRQLYLTFPIEEKLYALRIELTWAHYRLLLPSEEERASEINRERRWLKERAEHVNTGKMEGGEG